MSAKDVAGTRRLGDALVARGAHQFGGVAWEYYFSYGGGRAPWLSGMAQAVAAQAFTRAANLVPDSASTYLAAARGAYRVIPARLVTNVSAGPWIRLYSFDSTAVLNAQLQTIYSLKTYAAKASDTRADALATRMQTTAIAMLPRFDTGYWTYYSLPRDAVDAALPEVRRASPQPALDGRRPLRRRGEALRRLRAAAAGLPARAGAARARFASGSRSLRP